MKLCRGSMPVNAVEQNLFLLAYNKQVTFTFSFPTQRAARGAIVQRISRRAERHSRGTPG